jgi:glycosyltransferase involved in cell wall biosynthesis
MARGGDRSLLHHLAAVLEAIVLSRLLRVKEISHVHAHFGTNSAEVALLAHKFSGLSYSFTVHGPDEWDQPRQLKMQDKVRCARFVVAISSFTRAQLFRWIKVQDEAKVHVVRCGLDDEYFAQGTAELPVDPVFVCVGRLCEAKAQHLLVQAVARLRDRGVDVRLVLVGDGDLRAEVERVVREKQLESRVRITGWASDEVVRREINDARIFVLPSLAEGLPVALMEAMAAGRPVISTYVGGIAELIRDGVEGRLVPAGDIDSLAEAMESLARMQPQELAVLARAARVRVADQHRISTEVQRLATLFRESPGSIAAHRFDNEKK